MNDPEQDIERVVGLYVGLCRSEEYEHLIAAGLLRKSYDGPGGFLGLSKLVRVEQPKENSDMSDEDTPSLVVDNLRPDHVGGSAAMVIDGKEAVAPEARTWPNFDRWVATLAVIAAERAYWKAVDDYRVPMPEVNRLHAAIRTALDALDAVEKRPDFVPRRDCTRWAECKETDQCQAQSICP